VFKLSQIDDNHRLSNKLALHIYAVTARRMLSKYPTRRGTCMHKNCYLTNM